MLPAPVKATVAFTAILFAARIVRLLAAPVTEAETVILPTAEAVEVVSIVTALPASAVFKAVFRILEEVGLGVVNVQTPPTKAPPVDAEVVMVTSVGSNNHIPLLPETEEAFAEPKACRLSFEDVSIKPPSPPCTPPLANRSP